MLDAAKAYFDPKAGVASCLGQGFDAAICTRCIFFKIGAFKAFSPDLCMMDGGFVFGATSSTFVDKLRACLNK